MSSHALERRVEVLEADGGDGGGCERCSGVLVLVSNAVTGGFHSATWKGEGISEEESREHQRRPECPGCGRKLEPENAPVIQVGGPRGGEGPGRAATGPLRMSGGGGAVR